MCFSKARHIVQATVPPSGLKPFLTVQTGDSVDGLSIYINSEHAGCFLIVLAMAPCSLCPHQWQLHTCMYRTLPT